MRLSSLTKLTGYEIIKRVTMHLIANDPQVASSRKTNDSTYEVPRIIALGGDHTTTLSALRSTYNHWGAVSVIHFDSHLDTWNPEILGGGLSHYAGVNHGTFLHIAHEEGLLLNSSMHAGIRGPVANKHYGTCRLRFPDDPPCDEGRETVQDTRMRDEVLCPLVELRSERKVDDNAVAQRVKR